MTANNSTTRRGLKKRDFTLYIRPDTYAAIHDTCQRTGINRSALIEDILRIHFNLPPA